MKKYQIEFRWAIIFSLMGLVWMVLERLAGLHDQYIDYHMYLTNLFAIPAIIVMVMALKEKKQKYFEGKMSYVQGLVSGVILSLIIAILSPATQWVTSYVITPHYFENVIKRSVELGYYADTAAAEANFNYANYAQMGALGALMMGVITVAIAMIFLRSKENVKSFS